MSNHRLLDELWRALVIRPVLHYQAWRCKRAKRYLLRHDQQYRSQYAGNEIVRRREKLYAGGASPLGPTIPDRWTLEHEMPPMAWPRSRTLL